MVRILVTVLVAHALIGVASAESPWDSWENLRHLRTGERVEILDTNLKSHNGQFRTYTEAGISLREGGREITVPRAEVASVKRRGESHRRRNVLLGVAIGAAGGLAFGAIRGKTYHEAGETPVFISVWTPVGAGLGALVGASLPARSEVTVYRANGVRR